MRKSALLSHGLVAGAGAGLVCGGFLDGSGSAEAGPRNAVASSLVLTLEDERDWLLGLPGAPTAAWSGSTWAPCLRTVGLVMSRAVSGIVRGRRSC